MSETLRTTFTILLEIGILLTFVILARGRRKGYIEGKVFIEYDSVHSDPDIFITAPYRTDFHVFSRDMMASTKMDAGTIISFTWKKCLVGQYSTGLPAYQIVCHITINDTAAKREISNITFHGDLPPQNIVQYDTKFRPYFGNYPTDKIVAYLKSIPIRGE